MERGLFLFFRGLTGLAKREFPCSSISLVSNLERVKHLDFHLCYTFINAIFVNTISPRRAEIFLKRCNETMTHSVSVKNVVVYNK